MKYRPQQTLRRPLRFVGVGLRSGMVNVITATPAPASTGVNFITPRGGVRAHMRYVQSTNLTTTLHNPVVGVTIHTVEHLLAAFSACGVDNVNIVTGSHHKQHCIPILDGSAKAFADASAGNIVTQPGTECRLIVVRRPVEVELDSGERWIRLEPRQEGSSALNLDITMDFGPRIGRGNNGFQRVNFTVCDNSVEDFRREIAVARTFCFENDLPRLQQIFKGGSLNNSVVFGSADSDCMTAGGLRFHDEPCRHKLLDCIGDLSLVGTRLVGNVVAFKPGHELNRKLLASLLSNPDNYKVVGE